MKKNMLLAILLATFFSCTELLDDINVNVDGVPLDSISSIVIDSLVDSTDTVDTDTIGTAPLDETDSVIAEPFPDEGVQNAIFEGPLVIKKGGTYTGNYESLSSNTAAISIETSEKVILLNCVTRSVTTHINIPDNGNVEILQHFAEGLEPVVDNVPRGRFIRANNVKRMIVENCYFVHTSGIYVHLSTPDEIKIRYNEVKDIDGRHRNNKDHSYAQFVQFDKVWRASNTEIAWNYVVNTPFESFVEDNISTFASSGKPDDPIRIHDNFISGAYPIDPVNDSYSGGGILLGDYLAASSSDPNKCAGYIHAYNNTIINTTNYGMAIAGGIGNRIYNNLIISSGKLPDGRPVKAQNVGIYVWNGGKNGIIFQDNQAYDNEVGWMRGETRNDWWLPNCSGDCGNTNYSSKTITQEIENQIKKIYLNKASSNLVKIGCTQNNYKVTD